MLSRPDSPRAHTSPFPQVGDLAAAILSLVVAACHVPIEAVFWITVGANLLAAILAASSLPRRPPPRDVDWARVDVLAARLQRSTEQQHDWLDERCQQSTWDASVSAPHQPISPLPQPISDGISETRAAATRAGSIPPRRVAAGAVIAAVAVAIFMLPPTSNVASSSYVGQERAVAQWVLSARQLASMSGGLGGILIMHRLNLPLRRAVPVGVARSRPHSSRCHPRP